MHKYEYEVNYVLTCKNMYENDKKEFVFMNKVCINTANSR